MNPAYQLLALVAAAGALIGGGYGWGSSAKDNEWQAKDAKRVAADVAAAARETLRADKASGYLQAELLERAITNDNLMKAFNDYKKRNPILARRQPATVTAQTPVAEPSAPECVVTAGADPGISLGAVWMWNSALVGKDTPAGACGLADHTEGACAADSGISLEDAWDNQALNARICADNLVRHQKLIDYIKGMP